MTREMESPSKRPRICIDVQPGLRHRLRMAAARRDLTVRQYVLDAIEDRLRQDLREAGEVVPELTAVADPVLAELWNNERDAEYDRLVGREA